MENLVTVPSITQYQLLTAEKVSQETLPWPDLVILDRDGVINEDSKAYIKSSAEWHPIPGSLEAIAQLHQANIPVAVATNQRGIALGLYDHQALEEMHQKMSRLLREHRGEIVALEYCTADDPSHPDRKPNPGMLLKIMAQLEIASSEIPAKVIYFIGDKMSDVEAGQRANIRPILVRTGNGATTEAKLKAHNLSNKTVAEANSITLPCFDTLADFVNRLLSCHRRDHS